MSLKFYLWIISICTVLCWAAWLSVVFYINPLSTGFLGLLFFYLSLLFALIGTLSLVGFSVRIIFKTTDLWHRLLNTSSRQAIILSIMIILALIIQSFRFLFWWNLLFLVIMALLVEVFLVSYRRK